MKLSRAFLLSSACLATAANGIRPKMVAREATEDTPSLFDVATNPSGEERGTPYTPPSSDTETISSINSVFMGSCSPDEPFEFDLGSVSGRGAIGAFCSVADSVGASSASHEISVDTAIQPNFFNDNSFPEDYIQTEMLCGVAIQYIDQGSDGSATVTCGSSTDILVILKDTTLEASIDNTVKLASMPLSVDASVTCGQGGSQNVVLKGSAAANSAAPLKGQTKASSKGGNGKAPVTFANANKSSITIKKSSQAAAKDPGISLIQVKQATELGGSVYRTLITESSRCSPGGQEKKLGQLKIISSTINNDGDIELKFDGLHELEGADREYNHFKVDARVSIASELDPTDIIHKTVDMTAFLSPEYSTMVVHGGWVRRALHSIVDDKKVHTGLDVVVEAAAASDPRDNDRVVARLNGIHATGLMVEQSRRHLSRAPTREELGITKDMLQGRRPEINNQGIRGHRKLYTGKKILVHGYCAGGNPFPLNHFDNAIAFDSGVSDNNWRNYDFAMRIGQVSMNARATSFTKVVHTLFTKYVLKSTLLVCH